MKSKLFRLTLCFTILGLFTGCVFTLGGIRGSGIIKTESREVNTFSSISFTANSDQTRYKSNKLKLLSMKDYIWQRIH